MRIGSVRHTHRRLGSGEVEGEAEKDGQEGHEEHGADVDEPAVLPQLEGPLAIELAPAEEQTQDRDCVGDVGEDDEAREQGVECGCGCEVQDRDESADCPDSLLADA